MDSEKVINDILVSIFNEIWEYENVAIITDEFKDITNNDMHIIEAVGLGDGNNMSTIARKLKITLGSLTTSMNNLVKKGYAIRKRSEKDRRLVYIQLTEKGIRAYNHHKELHQKMIDAVMENLDENESTVLIETLEKLITFFKSWKK